MIGSACRSSSTDRIWYCSGFTSSVVFLSSCAVLSKRLQSKALNFRHVAMALLALSQLKKYSGHLGIVAMLTACVPVPA